jgi:hypothetical protein
MLGSGRIPKKPTATATTISSRRRSRLWSSLACLATTLADPRGRRGIGWM